MRRMNRTGTLLAVGMMVVAVVASTGVGAAGTPTVSVDDATVKAGGDASVEVTLDTVPNGLQKYNITVSLSDGTVADIEGVQAGDISGSSFSVVAHTEDSITFRAVDLLGTIIGPGDGPVDLGTVNLTNTSDGTTSIDVTVNTMTDNAGNDINPNVQNGTLTVTDVAEVTFDDQASFGDSVSVAEVFVPNDGFVVIHEQASDGTPGDMLTHSSFLTAGTHRDVQVSFDSTLEVEGTLIAMVHNDTDGDQQFDPSADRAYTDDGGDAITDSASIDLWYGAVPLNDGRTYWQGQDLHRSDGVNAGETVSYRHLDSNVVIDITDSDGDGAITISEDGLEGTYRLSDSNGTTLANFTVVVQTLDTSFADDAVKNNGNGTSTVLSVTSNRSDYAVEITSDGLSNGDLQSVFPGAALHDGAVVVTGVSGDEELKADFDGIDAGKYTVNLSVTDSTASSSASITVKQPTTKTTTVKVKIDGAPNGLQRYNITLSAPEDATIESVEGNLITSAAFQIRGGGQGSSFVTARGADIAGAVGSFSDSRTLFTVTYRGDLTKADLNVTVHTLTDDDGGAMDSDRVTIDAPEPETTSVDVVLDGAPNGLQKYDVTLSGPGGVTITSVEGGLITGAAFQITSGGEGNSSVTARGADLAGTIGSFSDSKTLFTVEFAGNVTEDDLSLTVNSLVDDDGNDMDPSRVSLGVKAGGVLFTEPIPGTGGANPPADPDGDGLYEDVDGDGDTDFDDGIALAFADTSGLSQEQIDALDFDNDGDVDFDDAIELVFSI